MYLDMTSVVRTEFFNHLRLEEKEMKKLTDS